MSRSPLISAAAVLLVPALPATAQTAAAPAVAPSINAELARLLSSARMWEARIAPIWRATRSTRS